MPSNREISRLLNLYAELLLLHEKGEKLAALLSGASYRIRNYSDEILSLNDKQLAELFRPEVVTVISNSS